MNIVIEGRINEKMLYGGIGNYIINLTENILRLDEKNSYTALVNNLTEDAFNKLRGVGLKVAFCDSPIFSFKEHICVPAILRDLKADLYHSPYYVIPVFASCDCVSTIHDIIPLKMKDYFPRRAIFYYRLMLMNTMRKSKKIIVDSEQTAHDISCTFPKYRGKIKVIPLGVDDSYTPIDDKKLIAEIRAKYGIGERRFIFYLGNFKPYKNLLRLIQSFSLIRKMLKDRYTLVIGGKKDEYYNILNRRVDSLGLGQDVVFTDFIDQVDLPALFNAAEVFVYPSLYEGFGLPVLEAMACGLPVVTSCLSSLKEVAGDSALLVDPYSVEEIALAIRRILTDAVLRQELVEKGLLRAKEFSWVEAAKRTLRVYEDKN